jgi:CubicO group peptidase (beta-lactamase class C family)
MRARFRSMLVFGASLSVALASPLAAQTAASAPAASNAARLTTTAGTELTLPAGWTSEPRDNGLVVRSSDGELIVIFVDVQTSSGAAALDAGWQAAYPTEDRPALVTSEQAPPEGWEESWSRVYRTSPEENRSVFAAAVRSGSRWNTVVVNSSSAALQRNGGAFAALMESARPAGFVPENLAGRPARPFDAARLAELRSFLETSMQSLRIPGIGYAVVTPDEVLFSGGLGVRTLSQTAPVDGDTLFMIASNTKNLTTLIFAQLVDEGRVRWDQPVTELYPAFRLGSAEATRAAQVRHLICACTGLPRRDFPWLFVAGLDTPASLAFDQLANVVPTSGFGAQYQYSNHLATAAGYVAGHVLYPQMEVGAAYDRAIRERVLNPLGMTRSTFDFRAVERDPNHAAPYGDNLAGTVAPVDQGFNHSVYFMRPTGGLWSSPSDMARYVQNELRQGVLPNGQRMVSAENLLMRRMRGVQTGETGWYGMGLETEIFAGVELIHHGGSMNGYKSDIVIFPEAGIGAVLLTNSENGGALLRPWLRRMVELLYDGRPRAATEVRFAAGDIDAELRAVVARFDATPNAAAVARLAPRYRQPDLGHITVSQTGGALRFDFGSFGSSMTTRRNDDGTTAFVATDPGLIGIDFTVRPRPDARYDALVIREAQHEYVYEPEG